MNDIMKHEYQVEDEVADEGADYSFELDPQPEKETAKERQAYTYMVECADGSLYTGWTYDLDKRMRCHNSGKGAKYTRSRLPVRLVYYELVKNKVEAAKREYSIKQLTRKDKLILVASEGNPVRMNESYSDI